MTRSIRFFVLALVGVACGDGGRPPEDGGGGRRSQLYVANTGGASLSVIDHDTHSVTSIDLGNQPHGQAPSSRGDRIYATTDGGRGEVIAIDPRDRSTLWRIDVGTNLNEPHLTRDDRFLYAPDLLGGEVFVVDVEQQEVVDTIAMVDPATGGRMLTLHNTYASHDGRSMYVTAILEHRIVRIDTDSREITRVYELSGEPRPAAISADDRRMYVQLSRLHGFIELDLDSGEETARIEWPEPPADALPEGIEGAEVLETKCHGLKISPDGTELWAATGLEGAVYVYSLPDLRRLDRVKVGNFPNWIAFSGDASTVYVTNSEVAADHGTVSVIDAASRSVVDTLDVGPVPKRIHLLELPEG